MPQTLTKYVWTLPVDGQVYHKLGMILGTLGYEEITAYTWGVTELSITLWWSYRANILCLV